MSKIVFILGAGASVHSGTPLMGNFLEVAEDLWHRGFMAEVHEHFLNVFNAIGNLQGIHSKAKIDTYNIETIYAAFEMGKLLKSLPGITDTDMIDDLIYSLKVVISYTLERTTKLANYGGEIYAPVGYGNFADMISKLVDEKKSFSIISFNYDLGLDYALVKKRLLLDYSLGDIEAKPGAATLLKLHGSLNWGKCRSCDKIIPYRQFSETIKIDENYSILPAISRLKQEKCCGQALEEVPFIVPPTWNKTAFHTIIGKIWERAAKELKDAENIFVLGYSLPSTDLFFNYLFALGVDMKTILKRFIVFNINGDIEDSYNNLLGSGIIQRFKFIHTSFEDAIRPEPKGIAGVISGVYTAGSLLQIIATL